MAEFLHILLQRLSGGALRRVQSVSRINGVWRRTLALCIAVSAATALAGPAAAQDIGLRRGEASLQAGQFADAARQLSATINDKDATINQVAKALYLRGIANRRAGYPGQAASDLGAAIWLGLPSSDKARAYVNKGLAYQAVGMESQGASAMAQARRYSSSSTVQKLIAQDGGVGPVASSGLASYVPSTSDVWDRIVPSFGGNKAAAPSASAADGSGAAATSGASTAAAEPQSAPTTGWDASVSEGSGGNAVTRWWDQVAGGAASAVQSTTPAPSAPAANTSTQARSAAPAPSSAPSAASTATSGSGTTSSGSGIGGWFSRQTAALTGAASGASSAAATGGGYTVQLANSSSKAAAEALWARARGSNSSLAGAPSRVEKVNMGSLGTFYTVKV
ncbi:MAG: SPOR domain-containing protein, partial [Pseudomonadota bacterium]